MTQVISPNPLSYSNNSSAASYCEPTQIASHAAEPESQTTPTLPTTPTKSKTTFLNPSFVSPTSLRIKEVFKRASLTSPKAIEEAHRARNLQRSLEIGGSSNEATSLSINIETSCYITKDKLFVTQKKAGRGGASEAWFADEINLSSTEEAPRKIVVKRSRSRNLLRERELTQEIALSPGKRRKLNYVEEVFEIPSRDIGLGIYEACESDLNHLRYSVINPVSQVLHILCDIAEGLCAIIDKGIVHRDIKGPNLLVTQTGGGSIGDFGLARRDPGRMHRTALTPYYAAPFIWKNLLDQKKRENGNQDQAADVFALGVTLQLDVFPSMLKQLAEHYQIDIKEKMNSIKPGRSNINPLWKDQDLLKIEETHKENFQRIIIGDNHLFFFKPRQVILQKILEVIDLFEEHICPEELSKMKDLAQLMHDLQDSNPENLTAAKTLERFRALTHPQEKAELEEKTTLAEKSEQKEI